MKNPRPFFHTSQVAICGHSGSGKTTLIEKLVSNWQTQYRVGYVKHDAHSFSVDVPGKDTHRLSTAGAQSVCINDQSHFALIGGWPRSSWAMHADFVNCDFVLLEGYKESDLAKIVVLDESQEMATKIKQGQIQNILALVSQHERAPDGLSAWPHFHRDDLTGICRFIMTHFETKSGSQKIKGLILSGGRSSRMGTDKATLDYHGQDQLSFLHQQMLQVCDEVFISCRADQSEFAPYNKFSQIHDQILNQGPMGGIVSALLTHPQDRWMVVAVDLPNVSASQLKNLKENYHPFKAVTAFINDERGHAEPLCAIYSPRAYFPLMSALALNMRCPVKLLRELDVHHLAPVDSNILANANNPQDFHQHKAQYES